MSENVVEETQNNINEAVEEMKESNSLTDILNEKTKYAEREVITYLNYDAAIEAFELQEEIIGLNNAIETASKPKVKSIVDEEEDELSAERDEKLERLAELNDVIQESRVVWTVRGIAPSAWRVIDKTARHKFPVARDAVDALKLETELKRNDYVNIEQIRSGLVKAEFADGRVVTEFSHDDVKHLFDNLPAEISIAVGDKIEELTFASRTFHNEIESADFLSKSW